MSKSRAFVYCFLLSLDGWLVGDYFRQEGVRSFFGWVWAVVCLMLALCVVSSTQKDKP